MIPTTSSPSTAGWFNRSISSPPTFAATRMAARARKKSVMSPVPTSSVPCCAPAARHAPKTSAGTRSHQFPNNPRYGRT